LLGEGGAVDDPDETVVREDEDDTDDEENTEGTGAGGAGGAGIGTIGTIGIIGIIGIIGRGAGTINGTAEERGKMSCAAAGNTRFASVWSVDWVEEGIVVWRGERDCIVL